MRIRLRPGRRLVAAAVSAVLVLGLVSVAWGAFGGGPAVTTFAIQLDSEAVTGATSYQLEGVLTSADRKTPSPEYTLRISLAVTGDPATAQAFQDGRRYANVRIDHLDAQLAVLRTYHLSDATVVAYRQSGDASATALTQELVLKSRTLTIATP